MSKTQLGRTRAIRHNHSSIPGSQTQVHQKFRYRPLEINYVIIHENFERHDARMSKICSYCIRQGARFDAVHICFGHALPWTRVIGKTYVSLMDAKMKGSRPLTIVIKLGEKCSLRIQHDSFSKSSGTNTYRSSGTSSIVDEHTREPILSILTLIVETAVRLVKDGHGVIIVSSGAVGVGLRHMDVQKRPEHLPKIQVCGTESRAFTIGKSGRELTSK